MKFNLVLLAGSAAASNGHIALNMRGRCAFGGECDENRISYGCDTKVGVCWSECIGTLKKTYGGPGTFQYEGWCFNWNKDMGALIDEMYAGKSGKAGKTHRHRGRRARPSAEKLAELVSEAEAEVDYDYSAYNITEDPNFLMGRPITEFQKCSTNEDCANMARHCTIGCSNMEEVNPLDYE